jgi:hypothetical protein
MRLTSRGERLLASIVLAVMAALLLAAFVIGQDRRCDWLKAHDTGLYATDCTTGGTR